MNSLAPFGIVLAAWLLAGCSSSSGSIDLALPEDGGTTTAPEDGGTTTAPEDGGTTTTPENGSTPTTQRFEDFDGAVLFAETLVSLVEGEDIVRAADVPQIGTVNYQGGIAVNGDVGPVMVGALSIDIDFLDFSASRGIADNFIVPVSSPIGSPYVDGSMDIENFVFNTSVVEGVSYGSFTADGGGVLGFSDDSETPEEFQITGQLLGFFAGPDASSIKGEGSFLSTNISCDGSVDLCGGGNGTATFVAKSN